MTSTAAIIRAEGEGEAVWFNSDLFTFKATADETNEALTLFEEFTQRGKATPLHTHPNADETFFVMDGEIPPPDADPFYNYLRAEAPGDFGPESPLYEWISSSRPEAIGTDEIKWNFTKFLIDPAGNVVKRYEPTVVPEDIAKDLEPILAK